MAILYIGAKVPRTRSIYGLPNDKATSRSPTLAVIFKPALTHIQNTPHDTGGGTQPLFITSFGTYIKIWIIKNRLFLRKVGELLDETILVFENSKKFQSF